MKNNKYYLLTPLCALAPNMSPIYGPGASGYSFPNYSVTFIRNSVTGNAFGAVNDAQSLQGPYSLNFSGNSLSLFLPTSDPATNAFNCSSALVWGCQNLNFSGNTMPSGGTGIIFWGSCSNSVILDNNFSGLTRMGVLDGGAGPETAEQMIGNILGCGYSYHLKSIFQEGPNWFLYNNQYLDAHSNYVPPFTDAASLWAHISP
ncbi:MAG TPA: hypothetical protein VGO67_20770 [Verrucomicrobiae bacterium]|jgi:parallel beta-helix repeat protein